MRELATEVSARAELLDLGCGVGRSLSSAMKRFDARGIGLELNKRKVEKAQSNGLEVFRANILDVKPGDFPAARYVTIDNVLEHLPDLDAVQEVLTSALSLARRLVYIRHPSFEDEDYLAGLGLKQYWCDWPGAHTAHIRLHELVRMANEAGCYHVDIRPVMRAAGSGDSTILPAGAPPNQRKIDRAGFGAYSAEKHGPKPDMAFDRPVYFAFDVFLVTGAGTPVVSYSHDPDSHPVRPSVRWAEGAEAWTPERGSLRDRASNLVQAVRQGTATSLGTTGPDRW